jgi:hypothetical protein
VTFVYKTPGYLHYCRIGPRSCGGERVRPLSFWGCKSHPRVLPCVRRIGPCSCGRVTGSAFFWSHAGSPSDRVRVQGPCLRSAGSPRKVRARSPAERQLTIFPVSKGNPVLSEFDETSECECCRNRRPFTMPDTVVHACLKNDLVVFAGAGVSTESRSVLPGPSTARYLHRSMPPRTLLSLPS